MSDSESPNIEVMDVNIIDRETDYDSSSVYILKACYYNKYSYEHIGEGDVSVQGWVRFYDPDGKEVHYIDLSGIDHDDAKLQEMLDPECQGKARPTMFIIYNDPDNSGLRTLKITDRLGYEFISNYLYDGGATLKAICEVIEKKGLIDVEWILNNSDQVSLFNYYKSNRVRHDRPKAASDAVRATKITSYSIDI